MRKFENILFFYSIVAVTILFISFGVSYPKPINFISVAILLPIVFYFWLKLTSPETTSAGKWSVRFLITIIALSAIGIYTYLLVGRTDNKYIDSLKSQLAQSERKSEELTKNITTLQAKLDSQKEDKTITPDVNGTSITDLIFETPKPDSTNTTHRITGKTGVTKIDVHAEASAGSTKIGALDGSVNYPYIEKQQDWYKIVLSGSSTGWVNVGQIQEL